MKYINSKIKEEIENSEGKIISINGKEYYIKKCLEDYPYLELVAERILNILGIPCFHYEAVRIENDIYYLSERVGKNGFIITGEEFRIPDDNLWSIWYIFLDIFTNKEDLMKAMNTIVAKYLFDILFLNSDGSNRNWAYVKNNGIERIMIFDNEFIFNDHEVTLSSKIDDKDITDSNFEYHDLSLEQEKNLKELEYFLDTWGNSYMDMLNNMVSLVPPEVVLNVIDEVESIVAEPLPKEKWINLYTKNYDAITMLLNSKMQDNMPR